MKQILKTISYRFRAAWVRVHDPKVVLIALALFYGGAVTLSIYQDWTHSRRVAEKVPVLQRSLQDVREQKDEVELKLEQKTLQEAQKTQENEELKKQLQSKREAEATLASVSTPVMASLSNVVPRALGAITGNGYAYGYCTYLVKERRPDIPNNWGHAYAWLDNARADGWATGSVPKVGAIAWAVGYGHVAYVIGVNGSSVTVEEANYRGWDIISTRATHTSEWLYIY